jgi:hypothetical protein
MIVYIYRSPCKGRKASQLAASDQRIDLVCALVGINALNIGKCSHHIVLVQQTVASAYFPTPTNNLSSSFSDPGFRHGDMG